MNSHDFEAHCPSPSLMIIISPGGWKLFRRRGERHSLVAKGTEAGREARAAAFAAVERT